MSKPKGCVGKEGQIQHALMAGLSLTQLDAWVLFRASRLAAVVHRLKATKNLTIESCWQVTPNSRFKRYWIPQMTKTLPP